MEYEPVIGLEVHAELQTHSKMFCTCPRVDATTAAPNTAVCPVCAGMPGVLPVINEQAVALALRVALALECEIAPTSIFARKNYFYPDLPKGYQISQYETPLASNGLLPIHADENLRKVRVRRVHLEEDTGKLTHVNKNGNPYSLVDLNRAGVPLLEIVSEPDLYSVEDVLAYSTSLRQLLKYLGVNGGNMEKGEIRFEANISIRPCNSGELGTRVEIKNLNSFKALERSINYEIERQAKLLNQGKAVAQETLGWDSVKEVTFSQRSKEEAHDYRYFPEPDLPPLVIEPGWQEEIRRSLPELPHARLERFKTQYNLNAYDAGVLTMEQSLADYFERAVAAAPGVPAKALTNWLTGDLFGLLNQNSIDLDDIDQSRVSAGALAALVQLIHKGEISNTMGKTVLAGMFASGKSAEEIIADQGLKLITDKDHIQPLVLQVIQTNPQEVAAYISGKEGIANWLFGQVMRAAQGKADPQVVRSLLVEQLERKKSSSVE